jgi:hypothetical protein
MIANNSLSVMANITEEIKKKREQTNEKETDQEETVWSESNRIESNKVDSHRFNKDESISQVGMTQGVAREWDSGTAPMTQGDWGVLTGKLCKRVMALIKWRCGADTAVDDCMVRALEGWLRRRGISIYIDLL